MTEYNIHRTADREITVDVNGRKVNLLYNPETSYALVPASIYDSEQEIMNKLKQQDFINGIFNHKSINQPD